MKKIVLALSLVASLAIVSCKKDTPPPTPPAPEVIVVTPEPATLPPPPPPPAPAKEKEQDGTTVSVGSNGVEVSTKSGNNKTVIDVKDGKGKIEIKK